MTIEGYISAYDGETLTIIAPFSNDYILQKQGINECEIRLVDGRTISSEQRKHIYATISDIAEYTGYLPDEAKAVLKYQFIADTGCEYFSLASVDMTTARKFLDFLINFCIENEIPTSDNLVNRAPDISRYLYACLINKTCCICGAHGKYMVQLHHVDRVGMGRDRNEIIHKGMAVMALCGKHHNLAHSMPQKEFDSKYHIYGIKADNEICKKYRLKEE
ncbi:MAG: putative HNHc nuclease [Oscillospiraceae bacterium]